MQFMAYFGFACGIIFLVFVKLLPIQHYFLVSYPNISKDGFKSKSLWFHLRSNLFACLPACGYGSFLSLSFPFLTFNIFKTKQFPSTVSITFHPYPPFHNHCIPPLPKENKWSPSKSKTAHLHPNSGVHLHTFFSGEGRMDRGVFREGQEKRSLIRLS